MYYYKNLDTGEVFSSQLNWSPVDKEQYENGLLYAWVHDTAQVHESAASVQGWPALTREQYNWWHLQRTEGCLPSYDETLAMQRTIVVPTLDDVKAEKSSALNTYNANVVAAGYTDPQGRVWGLADADRRAWSELATAILLSGMNETDTVPSMREINSSVIHDNITTMECKTILKGVALAYMYIDKMYSSLRAQILSAETVEAVQAIEINFAS